MRPESDIRRFIAWQDAYDAEISLINEQHKGILVFINNWYNEIRETGSASTQPDRIKSRLDFLVAFSKGHIRFESEMLKRLTRDYGYPRPEYENHMQAHRLFLEDMILPLIKKAQAGSASRAAPLLETAVHDSLFDIARWWSNHIRAPRPGEEPGPDHKYRIFLEGMPQGEKLNLINEMILYIALNDNTYWLRRITPAASVLSGAEDFSA